MTAPIIALLDDPSFLSQMHDLLTTDGVQTLHRRPQEVTDMPALVKRFRPALVILDCWWRRGDEGWAFLKKIWADPATMHTGVVLTIGQAVGPSLHIAILRAMRRPLVVKPLDRERLLRAIAAVLGPYRTTPTDGSQISAVPAIPASAREGTLDWTRQAQLSDLLRSVLTDADRRLAEEQRSAGMDDGARYQLVHDEGSGRWMALCIAEYGHGAPMPVRFFGPDDEWAARHRATHLDRAASQTRPTTDRQFAAMSDA